MKRWKNINFEQRKIIEAELGNNTRFAGISKIINKDLTRNTKA